MAIVSVACSYSRHVHVYVHMHVPEVEACSNLKRHTYCGYRMLTMLSMAMLTARGRAVLPRVGNLSEAVLLIPG